MNKILNKIKNKPLAIQIWLIIGAVIIIAVLLYSIALPFILRSTIISEKYDRLEETQAYIIEEGHFKDLNNDIQPEDKIFLNNEAVPDEGPPMRFSRVPRHFFIKEGKTVENENLKTVTAIRDEIIDSQSISGRSVLDLDNNLIIYYVYQEIEQDGEQQYLVSYLQSRYRDSLFSEFFKRMLMSLIFFLVLAWLISIFLAKYLSKSLQQIKKQVKKIARHEWDKPLNIERKDEIGELASTIEWLRKQLVERDQKQQQFLQEISHEIKTPIMVLRSYVQSMQDGIYPRGDLEGSLSAMEAESFRMEKRVKSLINITKMDYLSRKNLKVEKIKLKKLVKNKLEHLGWQRKNLNWSLTSDEIIIEADREKFEVIIENIVDNQFKFAAEKIKVKLKKVISNNNEKVLIHFWNDGPEIEAENLKMIFEKFKKGSKGEYGLGLAITKVLVELHEGEIWAKNEDNGVSFYLKIAINREEKENQ